MCCRIGGEGGAQKKRPVGMAGGEQPSTWVPGGLKLLASDRGKGASQEGVTPDSGGGEGRRCQPRVCGRVACL